ncbi:hypothetical protein [Microbacterium sp.]|uniref:hypothetical protein n=1 Tax=Microbacterium sp. TaxID=51671 RepID=UPI0039E56993
MSPPRCLALVVAAAVLALGALTACAGTPDTGAATGGTATGGTATTPAATSTTAAIADLEEFPIGPSTSTTPLPADLPQGCRDLLTAAVLDQLEDVPLNAEGMGGGIRSDSARVCVWGDPDAAATRLVTVIGYSPPREALDELYRLGNEGFTCYEPQDGIRCEKVWDHPTLPVEQGRTLFYRDGVIIDTQYTNLAPTGYTDAIIAALWPPGGRTATPTPTP